MFGLGVPELLIILAVVLLLFGGARLAGLGKSTGRALREFKEETKDLKAKDDDARSVETYRPKSRAAPERPPGQHPWQQPAAQPPQPAGPPAGHHLNPPGEPPINTAWQTAAGRQRAGHAERRGPQGLLTAPDPNTELHTLTWP